MKIVILDGFLPTRGDLTFDALRAYGEVEFYPYTAPEERAERMRGAVAVYVNRCALGREELEACPTLRFIGVTGTGYNMVDLEAAQEYGICVCNVPAYSAAAVAEMTFALLLEISRRTAFLSDYLHAGRWQDPLDKTVAGARSFELCGRTLGIVGLGDIGRRVARIARAMDMRVLACRSRPASGEDECGAVYTDFRQLLRESDIVSLHCPLNEGTHYLIGEAEFAQMKPGAVLLNTARGALVDEAAAVRALESGRLLAVGTDVLSHEPPEEGDSLFLHEHCVATPHVAWAPVETRERLIEVCAQNLGCFLAGHPQNVVGMPGLSK